MRIELEENKQEQEVFKTDTENIADEIKEQRRLLKGQGPKAYIRYFLDYYKWPVLIVIVAAVCIFSFVKTQLDYVKPELTAIMLNVDMGGGIGDILAEDFISYAQLEVKPESIVLDTSCFHTTGTPTGDIDSATQVKIMAQSSNGALDVLTADAYNFNEYALDNAFADLTKRLDPAMLKKLEDRIFYVDLAEAKKRDELRQNVSYEAPYVAPEEGRAYELLKNFTLPDPKNMKEPVAVGILMNGSEVCGKFSLYTETACLAGFLITSQPSEISVQFMDYLTHE